MAEPMSMPARTTRVASERRTLMVIAWTIVVLLTVPQIIFGAFMHLDVTWLAWARVVFLGGLLGLSFITPVIRPLRGMIVVFLVIYVVESWFFGTVVPQSPLYSDIFHTSAHAAFFGERLVRIGASLVMLLVLLGMGMKRHDFFLTVGNLRAVAEPERWGIPRKPETWLGFGGRYALIIVTILLIFTVPGMQPSLANLSVGLVLFAALCAVMNAFAEEFLYRSALLPQVLPVFGKSASLVLVAGWFGLGHYFGMPMGITGVILTFIGGWVMAKAMVETRGMGWPLILHTASDFTIYMVVLLAGGF